MSNNSMTSEPTTPNHIQQTLFAEVFLANQSQTRARAKGSQRLHNLVCGTNSIESFAYYSRDTSSWKTCQQSFLEDLESFSETWPRQGITVNGVAYQRRLLKEPVTREIAGGLLPTIKASEPGSTSHGYGDSLKEGICKQIGIPTKKYPLLPTPRAAKGMEMRLSKNMAKLEHKKYLETEMAARIHTHGETHLTNSKEIGENGVLNPSFCRTSNGVPSGLDRTKRLKALGNSIVPQVAAIPLQRVLDLEKLTVST